MRSIILVVYAIYISTVFGAKTQSIGLEVKSGNVRKRSKSVSSTEILNQSKSFKKKESSISRSSKPSIVAQRAVLSNVLRKLPFSRKPVISPVVVVTGPPPSSLAKINILMLMFYTTLGAAMPYIPLYYRSIGLSSKWILKLTSSFLKSSHAKCAASAGYLQPNL